MELITRAARFSARNAVFCRGRTFTYGDLLTHANFVSGKLLSQKSDMKGERVVLLTPQSYEYLACQWGIWQAGGVVVPLCLQSPPLEWQYVVNDCKPAFVICHGSFLSKLGSVAENAGVKIIPIGDFIAKEEKSINNTFNVTTESDGLILYTSGTTGKPKGAVQTHAKIEFQVKSLVDAWGWNENDNFLEVMPLHHVHSINNLLSALWSGASITFHQRFDPLNAWKEIKRNKSLTIFSALPTIYTRLLQEWNYMNNNDKAEILNECKKFRLMVSGAYALSEKVWADWQKATGHTLLERYGLTETGIVICNPLNGTRRPGWVGKPLPQVEAKIDGNELKIKSPGMFKEYFNNPTATQQAFDEEGWFKTGDIAEIDPQTGDYKICGRLSMDMIKTAGYKVSAEDMEKELKEHPDVQEIAVLGVPNYEYGEIIGVVVKSKKNITLHDIQSWCKMRMASYKIPRVIKQVDQLPVDANGKVNKRELLTLFSH
ncbi:unnamed protein product [Blepharisma stoltei]|uniref:Uncharacterized protein n=1 Tax=Blepharisma stoltei TaxID=1481888 RepID=A0AAU9IC12_9CILI|nr:unnamed protein product [Blepharisma stoltei]